MTTSSIDFDAIPAIRAMRHESGYEQHGFEVLSSQSREPHACCDGGQMCRKPDLAAAAIDYRADVAEQNPPLVPVAPPPIANGSRQPQPRKRYVVPPHAALAIVSVFEEGAAAYPRDDWMLLPVEFHVAKAELHLYRLREGNQDERHLHHALTRLAMAVEIQQRDQELAP